MNSKLVEVSRTIKVGKKYYMAPSMGYAGVECGLVEVSSMGTIEDYKSNDEVSMMINTFLEVDYSPEEYEQEDSIWVEYKYYTDDTNEAYVFPLQLFVDHSIEY